MERHYQSIAAIYGAETGLPVFCKALVLGLHFIRWVVFITTQQTLHLYYLFETHVKLYI